MESSSVDLASLRLPAPAGPVNNKDLGQEDFLTLMTTQLQNQDPFEPMESGAFLGQMAQFSTVSGIGDLNSSFSGLADSLGSNQALQGAAMVGRSVLVPGNQAALGTSGSLNAAAELPSSVGNLVFDVVNAKGEIVHRAEMGPQPAGRAHFSWDGQLADGSRAPVGEYQVVARTISGGNIIGVPTQVQGRVASVTMGGPNGLLLNVEGIGEVRLADVLQVS